MQLRYRFALPLAAICCLAFAVAPALAAKPVLTPQALPNGAYLPPGNEISSVCNLGQTGPALGSAIWFFPSDDYYYTVFDPAQCGCAAGMTNLVAHWTLNWTVPCSIFVQAWILPAVQTSPGCYVAVTPPSPPDPPSALCGPSEVTLLDGAAGGLITHSIPLPPCNCLANGQKAFVLVKIVSGGSCPQSGGALVSPEIVFDGTPDPCTSYNAYPGSGGPVDLLTFGFPGNMMMSVEADCCTPTPTLPGSWGTLKTLYR